jgi:hypothetical protein
MKNTVTQAEIDFLLDNAETQEHIFWDKELVISYKLPSSFTISGRAAVIDVSNFDINIGRKICRENAAHQLWQLEGYRKQLELQKLAKEPEKVCQFKVMGFEVTIVNHELQPGWN